MCGRPLICDPPAFSTRSANAVLVFELIAQEEICKVLELAGAAENEYLMDVSSELRFRTP